MDAAVLERLPADRPIAPSDDWSALSMPTLVVGTRDDPVHPFSCAVALQRRLPCAVLREVPPKDRGDADHRGAVADAIEDFLSYSGRSRGPLMRAVVPPLTRSGRCAARRC